MQGTWLWVADHDLDGTGEQLTIFAGRGLLSESQGPVWLIGTAVEHHTLYQYNLNNAANHYLGLIQTETVCVVPYLRRSELAHGYSLALLPAFACSTGSILSRHFPR